MNPNTIRWQAFTVAALLTTVAGLTAPTTALAIAGLALLPALTLNASYARALSGLGRPERRIIGDLWVARFIGIAFVLPALASVVLLAAGHNPAPHFWDFDVTETSVLIVAPAVLFALILLSSLVDWYYIRPRIDGVVCDPPCLSSGSDNWKRPTRRWFLHRGLVTVAYIIFALVVAMVLMLMLVSEHAAAAGVIGGVGGIASLLLIFAGDYRAQLPTVARWTLSPAYCLGDDLIYDAYRTGGRGYVLHVAVPVTKLAPLDDEGQPTGQPFVERKNTDLADAQLDPGITTACDDGCCKLNPECVVDIPRRSSDQYRRRIII